MEDFACKQQLVWLFLENCFSPKLCCFAVGTIWNIVGLWLVALTISTVGTVKRIRHVVCVQSVSNRVNTETIAIGYDVMS